MNTALHILSKILSTIWTIAMIPIELLLAAIFAIIIYILIYAIIVGTILWILTL
ncbi:MAG: hypothetical protein SNG27_09940 [Rikenellaceae bacterium]